MDGISKRFSRDLRQSLRYAAADVAREVFARDRRQDRASGLRPGEFAALEDISFTLNRGEALAVIGHNGSGKTTLLKILYGLIKPDLGEVRLHGRVAALIELGTGFNEVLTGKENIAINAAMLGRVGGSLDALTEQVVEFAELRDVIDTPLRYYSSGMKGRLAFSIAAHLEPDVFLVDEVLATGDIAFQRKCAAHIRQYLARGGSLVFVSHNGFQIQALCQRGMLLEEGRCTFAGSAVETVSRYFGWTPGHSDGGANGEQDSQQSELVRIDSVQVLPVDGDSIQSGGSIRVVVRCTSPMTIAATWMFTIWTPISGCV